MVGGFADNGHDTANRLASAKGQGTGRKTGGNSRNLSTTTGGATAKTEAVGRLYNRTKALQPAAEAEGNRFENEQKKSRGCYQQGEGSH